MNEAQFLIALGRKPEPARPSGGLAAPPVIAGAGTKGWVMDAEMGGLVPSGSKSCAGPHLDRRP